MSINKHKILVVEDEADIRQVLCFFLRHSGYDTLDVASGQEAIQSIPEYAPHLIVLDLMMQPLDGWAVLHWLHNNYKNPTLPVLILTASVHFTEQIRGFEAGAVEYMTKPVQPNKVVERVQLLLSLTEEERLQRQRQRIEDQRKTWNRIQAAQTEERLY